MDKLTLLLEKIVEVSTSSITLLFAPITAIALSIYGLYKLINLSISTAPKELE